MQFEEEYPFARGSAGIYVPMPFYKAYPIQMEFDNERQQEKDLEYLKSLFPTAARRISPYVEEECDKMEYEGSMMFDEWPDKMMIQKIGDRIYDQVKDLEENFPEQDMAEDSMDQLFTMAYDGQRPSPKETWLRDLIQVMLCQEMFRRRCRHRRTRRYY